MMKTLNDFLETVRFASETDPFHDKLIYVRVYPCITEEDISKHDFFEIGTNTLLDGKLFKHVISKELLDAEIDTIVFMVPANRYAVSLKSGGNNNE